MSIPTGPVTPKEVRDVMAIGLKSAEELHPDFPSTGESGSEKAETLDQGSSSITKRLPPEPKGSPIQTDALTVEGEKLNAPTRAAQPPNIFNMAHAFKVVEERILGPRK